MDIIADYVPNHHLSSEVEMGLFSFWTLVILVCSFLL